MAPKIVDRDEKKREIGLAALDHFAQKGFTATSISQIAISAGIGKGTIYDYFQSKEDLVGFSLRLYVNKIEEKVGNILLVTSHPKEQIRHYVFEVMDTFMKDPRSMGILLSIMRILIADKEMVKNKNMFNEMFQSTRQTIISIIEKGVISNTFKSGVAKEAEAIAINLIAFIDGIWFHSLINPEGIDLKVQVNLYLENLFQVIDLQ